jgi:hypothetical protein
MIALSSTWNDTTTIIGSCINCTMPANLLATLALILIGVGLATYLERRKLAFAASRTQR